MATDLTTIFGSEIKVYRQPREIQRQYAGFAGAHGLTAMHMGTRGYPVAVRGIVRANSRANCQAAIDAIESYIVLTGAVDYEFYSTYLYAVIFDKLELVPDGEGKVFHWNGSQCIAEFICLGRGIL